MDKFIIRETKKTDEKLLIGREEIVSKLKLSIDNNETVCLYGESGTGKTFLVESILNKNFIEIPENVLKSKQLINDFLEKLKNSNSHVVLDNFDLSLPGSKEILELQKITSGCFIIISLTPIVCDHIKLIRLENFTINQLVNLGKIKFSHKSLPKIVESAKKSRGNIRNFLTSLDFSDYKDIFKTPKQFVYDLVCNDVKYPETASLDCLGRIQEHGYSWGIIHENYLDSPNFDSEIAEWMSTADILDSIIYNNNWNILNYFNLHAIIMPAIRIGHSLVSTSMRPGSSWTKFSNFKMRQSRFKSMRIPRESVELHQMYLQAGDISRFLHYNLKSTDIDTINHLCVKNKLKQKNIMKLKKLIKNETLE